MAADGDLPAFEAVLLETSTREVINPPGVFEGALWASFLTSDDVTNHGYWNWEEIAPGTYDRLETSVSDLEGEPFWGRLDSAGHSVAVIDVPHARPFDVSNGIQLCEWGTCTLASARFPLPSSRMS